MIYTYDNNFCEIAVPKQNILKISKHQETIINRLKKEVEVDVFTLKLASGETITTRYEPSERHTLPLPEGLEVWVAYEDEATGEVEWDISRTVSGIYSTRIFSGESALLYAVTDLHDSPTEREQTLLVDRIHGRCRINSYEANWNSDLLATMGELLGKTINLVDEDSSFSWQNNDRSTPRTTSVKIA